MKTKFIVAIILLIVFTAGCTVEKPIGGERDEHGCLGPAGYTWNESVGACIREWELKDNQREAAKIAVDFIQQNKLTITEVMVARCPGCFLVKLTNPEYITFQVNIDNWGVKIDSFEDCIGAGYPVMESYPRQCSDGSQTWVEEIESKDCEVDSDCVVFGKDGDCNCGCYNKDALPKESEEGCFCAAPKSCECVDGTCEGIFE